ncbi:metallophosphoesterase family protein [Falsiroseomonas sp. HW251]|uniref:metallophosphoesterase family protein n=1 Tax=Falsiroseomonas sp. HW251 TaxID=3390998 RepID=UPI003D3185A9
MTRVVQISDTHLSPGKTHFGPNWAPLAAWVAAQSPDLVIHTGDVTVDGAGVEEDMRHCAALLATLPAPVLSVPGNHDVGEAGHPQQPVNAERLARWRRHLGPDWWLRDVAEWRLIGLDSMLFGSGLVAELEQETWLEEAMAGAASRRIAVFTHRPFMVEQAEEPDTGYWSVKPDLRRRMLAAFDRHDVAIVATGHLHRAHEAIHRGRRHIWSGAAAFLVGPDFQPPMPGEATLGAVVYDFHGREVTVTRPAVPGLTDFWIDHVAQEVYPVARDTYPPSLAVEA